MRAIVSERLSMREGSEVEVTYRKKGFKVVWYKAILETEPPANPKSRRRRQLLLRLLKDDSLTPLSELTSQVASFRPIPPRSIEARFEINVGCVVGADYKGGWWTGVVVKEIGDDKCLVLFESRLDIVEFERKSLRPHFDWVDEKMWVRRKHKLEFLRSLGGESVFSPGTLVEVSCKIDVGEVVWVPAMIIKEIEETEEETEECADENEETDEDAEEVEENEEESDEDAEENNEVEADEETNEETDEDGEEKEKNSEEIKEHDKKKYIVKFCDKPLSYKSDNSRPKETVGLRSVRPTPPPVWVEEYKLQECVEAFHGTGWRQGRVMGRFLPQKSYLVLFKASDSSASEELAFKHSDLRPLKVWEDGVWKTKELPLSQASEHKMDSPSLTRESGPPVTPSPGLMAQPLKQAEVQTLGKRTKRPLRPMAMRYDYSSTGENENGEDDNRKRKRQQNASSISSVEETTAKKAAMVLPFEKKSPIWKTVESMEVFKSLPQSPHFSPLAAKSDTSRELSAVGMMFTFSGLLEEVKNLQLVTPKSTLESLNSSFDELEKHGFDVKAPQSRIQKLWSLKATQAEKMEELKGAEKELAEKESDKVEIEQKISELQRLKGEAEKEIAQIKSRFETNDQQLGDVELQFQTIVSSPW